MKALVAILVLLGVQAQASEFTPYLGVNFGSHSVTSTGSESAKNGSSLGVKLLGSWEFPSAYLDAGIGYNYMQLSSSQVKITTRSFIGELEARYKLTNAWSLGVAVRVMGGTDNTNSETIGGESTNNSLLGKLVYQTSFNGSPARVELGAGSTVGLTRNMTTLLIGVQMALPWTKEKPKSVSQVHAPAVAPRPPVKAVVKEEVADLKVDLKMARVRFDSDKFEIGTGDEVKLAKLANFLRVNNANWARIKISGHTDQTGESAHNKQLSQDRADAVMKVFAKHGVDETKMSANGYGSDVPVDASQSRDAWMKNRRTEIEFFGVKNRVEFNKRLVEALK